MEREMKRLVEVNTDLENETKRHIEHISQLERDKQNLRKRIVEQEIDKYNLRNDMCDLEKSGNERLERRNKRSSEEHAAALQKKAQEIDRLTQELRQAEDKILRCEYLHEETVEALNKKHQRIVGKLEIEIKGKNSLKAEVNHLQEEIFGFKKLEEDEKKQSQERTEALEAEKQSINELVQKSESVLIAEGESRAKLEKILDDTTKTISQLSAQLESEKADRVVAETKLRELTSKVDESFKAKLELSEKENTALLEEKQALSQTNKELREKNAELVDEKLKLSQTNQQFEADKTMLQKQLDDLQEKNAELLNKKLKLSQTIKHLEADKTALQKQLDELEKEAQIVGNTEAEPVHKYCADCGYVRYLTSDEESFKKYHTESNCKRLFMPAAFPSNEAMPATFDVKTGTRLEEYRRYGDAQPPIIPDNPHASQPVLKEWNPSGYFCDYCQELRCEDPETHEPRTMEQFDANHYNDCKAKATKSKNRHRKPGGGTRDIPRIKLFDKYTGERFQQRPGSSSNQTPTSRPSAQNASSTGGDGSETNLPIAPSEKAGGNADSEVQSTNTGTDGSKNDPTTNPPPTDAGPHTSTVSNKGKAPVRNDTDLAPTNNSPGSKEVQPSHLSPVTKDKKNDDPVLADTGSTTKNADPEPVVQRGGPGPVTEDKKSESSAGTGYVPRGMMSSRWADSTATQEPSKGDGKTLAPSTPTTPKPNVVSQHGWQKPASTPDSPPAFTPVPTPAKPSGMMVSRYAPKGPSTEGLGAFSSNPETGKGDESQCGSGSGRGKGRGKGSGNRGGSRGSHQK